MYRVYGTMDADHRRKWLKDPIGGAKNLADALEAANVAPWQKQSPAPTETAAKVGGPWQRIANLADGLKAQAHYYGALNIFPVAEEIEAIARANGGAK